ncbi:hypothetical protein [Floridanema evergladense]|uniref:Uncharacterized protein n=1 Tax=Floridaenema evergladense BLCC-F167 TaxID=3153639 RepID=A0ABV4WEB2_9CYAN
MMKFKVVWGITLLLSLGVLTTIALTSKNDEHLISCTTSSDPPPKTSSGNQDKKG